MIGAARADARSTKVREYSGNLLKTENTKVLKVNPPDKLIIALDSSILPKLGISVHSVAKEDVTYDEVYEKKVEYTKFKHDENLCMPICVDFLVTLSTVGLWGCIGGTNVRLYQLPNETRTVGEITIPKKRTNEIKLPLKNHIIAVDYGPAGYASMKLDDNGKAVVDLQPLLNKVTKDYNWQIKVFADVNSLSSSVRIVINTSS
jgi:hypothetical protein